jgi:hypothetical protein
MSAVRLSVGTRKGAFILTSDGRRERWDISGPQFAGWEIYHIKADPQPDSRGRSLRTSHRDAPLAAKRPVHAEALRRDAQRRQR